MKRIRIDVPGTFALSPILPFVFPMETIAMLSAAALASMAGLAPELCAALAGYGIVLGLVLVPLLAAALS